MNPTSFIKLFIRSREVFERYYPHVKRLSILEQEHKNILSAIENYYKEINHEYLSIDELKEYFKTVFPKVKNPEIYDQLFQDINDLDVSNSVITVMLNKAIKAHVANMIFQDMQDILFNDGETELEKTLEHIETYNTLVKKLDEQEEGDGCLSLELDDILASMDSNGLEWKSKWLQDEVGNLPRKRHVHIAARPNVGKTTFVIDNVRHWLPQLEEDEHILWFFNEEDGNAVLTRLYCAICNATEEQIRANKSKASEIFKQKGGHKIKFWHEAGLTLGEVRRRAEKYKPRLIILDNADDFRLTSYKGVKEIDRLGTLYREYRALDINFDCTVITVAWSDSSTGGKKWITQDDLDRDKVTKPGTIDLGIGIGKTDDDSDKWVRFINIFKNKITKNENKTRMEIQPDKARYVDL